eukprot:TRINITY_DN60100_c0_g1_i1.p1 TRINITY_DN60100_c0_g1~~TRINITY_DN60100_c0_g1_i1.p1  ORF type:complete len:621 (+),score=213.02 TRINITY_DN60100_c0_g1_i1:149-1864(+)
MAAVLPPPRPSSAPPGRPLRPAVERPSPARGELWAAADLACHSGSDPPLFWGSWESHRVQVPPRTRPSTAATRHRQHLQQAAAAPTVGYATAGSTPQRRQWAPRAKNSSPAFQKRPSRQQPPPKTAPSAAWASETEVLAELDRHIRNERIAWTELSREREQQLAFAAQCIEAARHESRARQMELVKERHGRQQLLQYRDATRHRAELAAAAAVRKREESRSREHRRRLLQGRDEAKEREAQRSRYAQDQRREDARLHEGRMRFAESVLRRTDPVLTLPCPAPARTSAEIARDADERRDRRERLNQAMAELSPDGQDLLAPYLELEYLMSAEQRLRRAAQLRECEEDEDRSRTVCTRDETLRRAGQERDWSARYTIIEERQAIWRVRRDSRLTLLRAEMEGRLALSSAWKHEMASVVEAAAAAHAAADEAERRRRSNLDCTVATMLGVSQEAERHLIVAAEDDARDDLYGRFHSELESTAAVASERAAARGARMGLSGGRASAEARSEALRSFRERMESRRLEEEEAQRALRERGTNFSSVPRESPPPGPPPRPRTASASSARSEPRRRSAQ